MNKTIHLSFDANLHPVRMLKSGKLTCGYEHGNLRYIKSGKVEIVRMIYTAVRDENWYTVPYAIGAEKIEELGNGFIISYTAVFGYGDIYYKADILIRGENNAISFSMKGEALSSFKRNRIGICVLHPVDPFSGMEASITRPDGTGYSAPFPESVSPHQPFREVSQMQWSIDESNDVLLDFYGDVFETEDQRNWVDHSYKTYGTPAGLPSPVEVKPGDVTEQKVVLNLLDNQSAPLLKTVADESPAKLLFPKIGYCRVNKSPLSEDEIRLLQAVPFDHYRVELPLYVSGWKDELHDAILEARKLDTKLELVLFFDDYYQDVLREFTEVMQTIKHNVESVLVLEANRKTTTPALLRTMYPTIKAISSTIKIGYGTDGSFADLNRNLPGEWDYDFVSFSMSPQTHLNDTRTLLENLEAQSHTLKTLRESIGLEKEIYVSPITFKARVENADIEDDYDSRQHIDFGAVWTLLTVRNLSSAHLTLYDTVGYKGIISIDHINRHEPSPLYQLLAEIKAFQPVWILAQSLQNEPDIVLENAAGDYLTFRVDALYFNYAMQV